MESIPKIISFTRKDDGNISDLTDEENEKDIRARRRDHEPHAKKKNFVDRFREQIAEEKQFILENTNGYELQAAVYLWEIIESKKKEDSRFSNGNRYFYFLNHMSSEYSFLQETYPELNISDRVFFEALFQKADQYGYFLKEKLIQQQEESSQDSNMGFSINAIAIEGPLFKVGNLKTQNRYG